MSWTIKGNGTGQDLLYSQAGTPSLDLRFASTKSLNDYVSGNNLITFTRASTGTFVGSNGLIQTAAINAPRFDHNPQTGESLGLLVEEARTNLVAYSEQFDNAWWTKDNTTVVANATTGPDGTATADKIVETTTLGGHVVYRNTTLTSAIYTYSVFLKKSERNWAYVRLATVAGQGAYFNLDTGTIGTIESGITATMQNAGNGWYRCSVSITASTSSWYPQHGPTIGDNTSSYTGDGSSGIFTWGSQLELGAFPTSYIPTVASTVTRAADVASITGANFSSISYNQLAGTALFTGAPFFNNTANLWRSYFAFTEGTTNGLDGFRPMQFNNTNMDITANQYNGNYNLNIGAPTSTNGSARKLSVSHQKGTGISACFNGGSIQSRSTNEPYALRMDRLIIAGSGYLGAVYNGTIARLTYWPTRLANTTLQTITQ